MLTPTQLAHALDMLRERGRVPEFGIFENGKLSREYMMTAADEEDRVVITFAIEDVLLDNHWYQYKSNGEYHWYRHRVGHEIASDRHTAAYQALCRVEGEWVR